MKALDAISKHVVEKLINYETSLYVEGKWDDAIIVRDAHTHINTLQARINELEQELRDLDSILE